MPAGDIGHRGEFLVYRDTTANTWLFDAKGYGRTGSGFDFIVGNPDGQFVFCFKDDKGKKRRSVRSISEITTSRSDDRIIKQEFEASNQATGKSRSFDLQAGVATAGKEFVFSPSRSEEKTFRYLADTQVDFQSIVYFNFIEGEVKLPYHFPTDIPLGKMLLEDSTTYQDGRKIVFRLKAIGPAEIKVDLSQYR
ncbi:hypothetical protein GCM10023091_10270 [Ravibacter arvi]|uniref:Uncharacterized protein n=2 Tax=Ravibacter arvi TaxID=2051041 RepID=A0ABP8LS53_9BACT